MKLIRHAMYSTCTSGKEKKKAAVITFLCVRSNYENGKESLTVHTYIKPRKTRKRISIHSSYRFCNGVQQQGKREILSLLV